MQTRQNIRPTLETFPACQDKQKFVSMNKQQRSEYILKMLQIKQLPHSPTKVFEKSFPSQSQFKYLDFDLHYYSLQQTQSPKAIFISSHGMNWHSLQSGYLASVIAEKNKSINVYSFDQMNFGKSGGPFRGQISSLQDTSNQIQTFVQFLLKKFKAKPKVFLCGFSYGGAATFNVCLKSPQKYSGAILLSPAIRNLSEVSPFLKKIGKFLGCICPRVRLFKDTYQNGSKYDNSQNIAKDPYIYNDGLVPGSARAVLNAMDELSTRFHQFSTPYLLIQGGRDKIVDLFAPLDLQQVCASKDKTTIYYEQMWHAVLAEEEVQEFSVTIANWVQLRI